MNKRSCWRIGVLVVVLAAAPIAYAEDNALMDVAVKVRVGIQAASVKDNLNNKTIGFGFDTGFNTAFGRFGVELGWFYKPGDHYNDNIAAIPVAPGNSITPSKAVESRKNQIEGFSGRLSYQKKLGECWGFIGGVQLGSTYRQEYIGDVAGTNTGSTAGAFRDSYNGNTQKTVLGPSPFVGVTYQINSFSSLELNVVALRYTAINYVHQAGYVAGNNRDVSHDYTVENARTLPHIEVGYVFRF